MKKFMMILSVLAMVTFIAMPAFACDEGPRSANFNSQFQAYSEDASQYSYGNEYANSSVSGYAGGTLDVHANADGQHWEVTWENEWVPGHYTRWGSWVEGYEIRIPHCELVDNPAIADGQGKAYSESHAYTSATDHGMSSEAHASAITESNAWTEGVATGLQGGLETVDSTVWAGGSLYQNNYAAEVGYNNGQGVWGFNESGGSFYAEDTGYDSGSGFAHDYNHISGKVKTAGNTLVTIDPYGYHRSFSAMTDNMVNIDVSRGLQNAGVHGNGQINGLSQNGATFAGGRAFFGYSGGTYGAGDANLSADIYTGQHSSSVEINGHAYSTSTGTYSASQPE